MIEPTKANTCGEECQIFSRVNGYYRPVQNWNKGKQEEFKDRKTYDVGTKSIKSEK